MSDKEILTKAIAKAIAGGWELTTWLSTMYLYEPNKGYISPKIAPMVIFNHKFAKALWPGEEWQYSEGDYPDAKLTDEAEYHLQQMVISDSPIEYLGKNI
jgi:hypothetical protein